MAIDFSQLSGTEYQKQIFEVLTNEIFKDPRVLSAHNHPKGAVDYVVRERQVESMLDTDRIHYFECKNYSRTLELSDVAKFMVVAVVEKPLSANLVSSTDLQPQAIEYASRIFNVIGNENTNPQFSNIYFRHWKTDFFCNKNPFQISPSNRATNYAENKLTWWIAECSAFSEVEIASFQSCDRELSLSHGALLLLRLYLPDSSSNDFTLPSLPKECWDSVTTALEKFQGQRRYLIDTAYLEPGIEYIVSVGTISGARDDRTKLCRILINDVEMPLPELRPEEIAKLSSEIGSSGSCRLALIAGEAGVGKTHLIEKVAEGLRARAGFDVIRFTVQEKNSDALMKTVLRSCLAPPIEGNAFEELTKVIEEIILRQTEGGTIETDFNLLVRTASRMGNKVVVLRDCHLVTTTLADQIWMFISALDDTSWGGIRLVLEYRQPDGQANLALQELICKIHLNIRKVLLERKILPIEKKQFSKLCTRLFAHVTDDLKNCLYQRTGGLPLFIASYMYRLLNLGVISKGAKGLPYTIVQPARLMADSLPEGGQIILEGRIQICVAGTFGPDWKHWAIILGMIAIAEDYMSQALICDALNLSDAEIETLQTMLEKADIGYGRPNGQIYFRHDLLREAAIAVATSVDGFALSAKKMASNLLQNISCNTEVRIRAIRVKVFGLLKDNGALEIELRNGLPVAKSHGDYGRYIAFLTQILDLLRFRYDSIEWLDFMSELAWATWVSDSLWVARDLYRQLAEEAEQTLDGDFSICENIATDAYRRALGIDLELVEPQTFLENAIAVLLRRQNHRAFNSIMNRLVLFCARFGFPEYGYKLAKLAFDYIGNGDEYNQGSVLCSELGSLYASSEPSTALSLFRQAFAMAMDETERACNTLEIFINESLYQGMPFDLDAFGLFWKRCSEGKFSETLTRASLLRGSLLLREGDLKNAGRWIERTATLVQVHRMKQFEAAIINDQVLYSLMCGNQDDAKKYLKNLVAEFERIARELKMAPDLVEKVWQSALTASEKLPKVPSTIARPMAPPEYCDPIGEIRWNILMFSKILDIPEITEKYSGIIGATEKIPPVGKYRLVEFQKNLLILGAY